MKFPVTTTQIMTAAAVLLLLGGFTAAFAYTAQGQANVQSTAPLPTASKSTTYSTSVGPTATTTSVGPTATTTSSTTKTVTCLSTTAACGPICPDYFVLKLNPVIVPTASSVYRYGSGEAILTIRGDAIYLQAEINRANPLTQYSITLDINGVSHLLATMVTDQNGNGQVTAQILLQNGVYAISVQVFDTTSFSSSTLVLQSASVTVMLPAVSPTVIVCGPIAIGVNAQAK
jgi:hypothetical protein